MALLPLPCGGLLRHHSAPAASVTLAATAQSPFHLPIYFFHTFFRIQFPPWHNPRHCQRSTLFVLLYCVSCCITSHRDFPIYSRDAANKEVFKSRAARGLLSKDLPLASRAWVGGAAARPLHLVRFVCSTDRLQPLADSRVVAVLSCWFSALYYVVSLVIVFRVFFG